ncbi:LPS export ABC transporter periplasmic protein LptC [uncultured Campylobacter sp.]|uniref:LPS export ABC transporter periplasmic protein LptC n=1 Tax=uncultured Campylobacter sp. TaxID=218934 RepID=UPI002634D6CB|nr:LPS export ABC transporter periplasmic protein LptC [uncultured Campylobacter sp.]
MVLKVFNFFVILFTISMIYLVFQTPYEGDFFVKEPEVALIQIDDFKDFELDENSVFGYIEAKSAIRYKDKDELSDVYIVRLDDINHSLSSKKATFANDILTFYGDALYKNSDNLTFASEQIVYDLTKKEISSPVSYLMKQGKNRVVGDSIKYETDDKKIYSKGIKSWYLLKE